jgi:hypothetical protein
MEKKAKMAKDTLGMEPAVHRKELENRIAELEKEMDIRVKEISGGFSTIKSKIDQICTRIGITKLQ